MVHIVRRGQKHAAMHQRLWRLQHEQHGFAMGVHHLRLFAFAPDMLGSMEGKWFGGLVEVPSGGWQWSFPLLNVASDVFATEELARTDLCCIRRSLYPEEQLDATPDRDRLVRLRAASTTWRAIQDLTHSSAALDFARPALERLTTDAVRAAFPLQGLPNLGNTCYMNAVLQCLFHTRPFRDHLRAPPPSMSFMGDRLRALQQAYVSPDATTLDIVAPLAAFVSHALRHSGWSGGSQQDAAEFLTQIFGSVDHGQMAASVCGATAASHAEHVIMVRAPEEALVSSNTVPVSMANMLLGALCDDQLIAGSPDALVLQIANSYEAGGELFPVDVRVDWGGGPMTLSPTDSAGETCQYAVSGLVCHLADTSTPVVARMRSGHYVAYLHVQGSWYEMNDSKVSSLREAPQRFPYLVFLTKVSAASRRPRLAGKQHRRCNGNDASAELLARRVASRDVHAARSGRADAPGHVRVHAHASGGQAPHRGDRVRDGCRRSGAQDRSDRAQDRTTRQRDEPVAWALCTASAGTNRDGSRTDILNGQDHPFRRYKENWPRRRRSVEVSVKVWPDVATATAPQPCRLCQDLAFLRREDWQVHVDAEHGGVQRYRNALFALLSLSPYKVHGSEWRAAIGNFAEFQARSAVAWDAFTPKMEATLANGDMLQPADRWEPRAMAACVFCARRFWKEELQLVHLAGEACFMPAPAKVADLLDWRKYAARWPDIPEDELRGSSVSLRLGTTSERREVLLHRRRVDDRQADGCTPVHVCHDCHDAFGAAKPGLCKYALANDMWLGRWHPVLRRCNLSHQMLLALARIVTTKVVLRAEGKIKQEQGTDRRWDFLFHQSGMIGSAILFGNASCKDALPTEPPASAEGKPASYPPASLGEAFAVSFVGPVPEEPAAAAPSQGTFARKHVGDLAGDPMPAQRQARHAVSKIAKLMVKYDEFVEESSTLQRHNYVYKTWARRDDALMAKWNLRHGAAPSVPAVILDRVVAVPTEEAGDVQAAGPGDATAAGQAEQEDAEFQASRQSRCISAFHPDDIPVDPNAKAAMDVASLEAQLKDLDEAAQRSVAAEVESAVEGGACLMDEVGRARVLDLCAAVRKTASRISSTDRQYKLQAAFQRAANGVPQKVRTCSEPAAGASSATVDHLTVPRGKRPMSLFDWRAWTQARPTLWCYGDASNLYPDREVPLTTREWICCLCRREEMQYDVRPGEGYTVRAGDAAWEINRFTDDWTSLHLFATIDYLAERHQSAFAFLKSGGLKWAEQIRRLTPETLANAARLDHGSGGLQSIAANKAVPLAVKQALNAMQMAFADVVGTDGHRRLCRHEGVAYMVLFGAPLIFCTPNLADTKNLLLLIVQGEEVTLDSDNLGPEVLPTYRQMMQRLARDPVGQTLVFELMMRLFFVHLLGVRPECVAQRRRANAPSRKDDSRWCTDGVAADSAQPGIFGPVLSFRGEVEAQGRGSLHPHILVWLLGHTMANVLLLLRRSRADFRERLAHWMKAVVVSMQSMTQSSVQTLPRQFGDLDTRLRPLGLSKAERGLCRYDGGNELDTLQGEIDAGLVPSEALRVALETEQPRRESWLRPCLPLRDVAGHELPADTPTAPGAVRASVFSKRLSEFAVSRCPSYRRPPAFRQATASSVDAPAPGLAAPAGGNDAEIWQRLLGDDVRELAAEILVHICGESCFKYSGSTKKHICRHGFYYVIGLEDWMRRRRGKALRNALFVVQADEYGMKGRILQLQEHPFECQSNYAAIAGMRCNFDAQDLRRVLADRTLWLGPEEELPHVGSQPHWGYMNTLEWNGTQFETRPGAPSGDAPCAWGEDLSPEEWRRIFLGCFDEAGAMTGSDRSARTCSERGAEDEAAPRDAGASSPLLSEGDMLREAGAAFSDGINTGFYINSYTTKQCPTMEGVLEEMRRGLERLQEQAAVVKEKQASAKTKQAAAAERASQEGDSADPHLTPEEQQALSTRTTRFGETLRTLKRLSASYRRCYCKSGAEMLFPIFFGHMTFASHRCWTVYIKKAVFLAAQAWRQRYGDAIRHGSKQDAGGEMLRFNRQGFEPYELKGWKRVRQEGNDIYIAPDGSTHLSLYDAYVYEQAQRRLHDQDAAGAVGQQTAVGFLQKFLNDWADESLDMEVAGTRLKITTSTLEDYLYRGNHPLLAPMSLFVYAMWVFRIERPPPSTGGAPRPRFIDLAFAPQYQLHHTHLQRVATEFRVPLFEGFTMPTPDADVETACMYKQILLRPISATEGAVPPEEAVLAAFQALSCPASPEPHLAGAAAFSMCWTAFRESQERLARLGNARFLVRYDYPSLWETHEAHAELSAMWRGEDASKAEADGLDMQVDEPWPEPPSLDPSDDPDSEKPRASVEEYVAVVGDAVALNLDGVARSRVERKQRQYRTDAEIVQAYVTSITGGGEGPDGDDDECEPGQAPAPTKRQFFEPVPWNIETTEEMQRILDFGFRYRLSPLVKGLLALPCMQSASQPRTCSQASDREAALAWRTPYCRLSSAENAELLDFLAAQRDKLRANPDEADPDVVEHAVASGAGASESPQARFEWQRFFARPSALVVDLVQHLPAGEKLTRDQTLLVARFAKACDEAWEDETKPPDQRRTHHLLLLGQGGSGKTHVVQNIVFKAVELIWPPASRAEPTLMVCAASNAQAKGISSEAVKARTLHTAAAMRVQELTNAKMRPGNKRETLVKLWGAVRCLVIEEISMVSPAWYNMLDFRAMAGRSLTHDVSESTYALPNHAFGRVPIVIHLGDFLRLCPTASLSLITDVTEKLADGSYKVTETPSVEAQHAMHLFKTIPHIFELRGTKRFKPGDPLIDFLDCMRQGKRIQPRVWAAFEQTFASDNHGVRDPRHTQPNFCLGYGLALYWDTLARWIPVRARAEATSCGVPLVFLQAVDQCNTITPEDARRLLNVPNAHNTGNIPGVLPAHEGMMVRLQQKIDATLGLVQEQKARIVGFIFEQQDKARYAAAGAGDLFRPKHQPAGIMLQVDGFTDSPVNEEALDFVTSEADQRFIADDMDDLYRRYGAHVVSWRLQERDRRARGLLCLEPSEVQFRWKSTALHEVTRTGFCLTHGAFFTSTSAQGQTLRAGVTIDCARLEPQGKIGMDEDAWWLHLYVMFSRATCVSDMLLLRPPPRRLLEKGPPPSVMKALAAFERKIGDSVAAAEALAAEFGFPLPA